MLDVESEDDSELDVTEDLCCSGEISSEPEAVIVAKWPSMLVGA